MPRFTSAVTAAQRALGVQGFPNMQVFTSSGTFTVPSGVSVVWVSGCGGGGGGGRRTGGAQGGGGGASVVRRPITVTPGVGITVTVGAGGAGATTVGTEGANGSSTTFGALLTLPGGGGGLGGTNGQGNRNGGSGRVARFSHPQLRPDAEPASLFIPLAGVITAGQHGQPSEGATASNGVPAGPGSGLSGRGGASFFSSIADDAGTSTGDFGLTPVGFGAGGGGSDVSTPGVTGLAGILIVEW